MDWTAFTAAVSFGDVATALGSIGIALTTLYVVKKGIGVALGMLNK